MRILVPAALVALLLLPAPVQAQAPVGSVFTVVKTASIGTTAVLASDSNLVTRRTIRNTGSVACEIGPTNGFTYGAGHPLPAGESFTFDANGQTSAALYVACASAGGTVSVISY